MSITDLKTNSSQTSSGAVLGQQLTGMKRCPHCGIASPRMNLAWSSHGPTHRADGGHPVNWAAYCCVSCGSIVTCSAEVKGSAVSFKSVFPEPRSAHEDIPEPARAFLQQAYETLHAPDAAAIMAGSAIDAMLKAHGLVDGGLYSRIDEALAKNLLTQGMADWAHEVRLGSNRPRHADKENPHVSPDEAKQSVAFAEALGNFLFVLTARIDRGLKEAKGGQAK
jgi:hypothetical protein